MPEYRNTTQTVRQGKHNSEEYVNIVVVCGASGSVEVQYEYPDGQFRTPTNSDFTLTEDGIFPFPGRNSPELRVVPIGTAQFYVIGA